MTPPPSGDHDRVAGADEADAARRRVASTFDPRLLTERVLLSALRAQDAEAAAEAARERAAFLADAGLRLGASLDRDVTYAVIAGLALPGIDGWCVVDVIETSGTVRRLAVVHPDAEKDVEARALAERWLPGDDDRIGVPAVARDRAPVLVPRRAAELIAETARDAETARVLQWLGAGSLLVVPMLSHDVLLGAITYVSCPEAADYSADDVRLALALAARCAQALEASRLYAAARAARAEAERANAAKVRFLRAMSHELRTPLTAIAGYSEIMEMGIHGPVTEEQRIDLARIRASQRHLLGLVNEVLEFAQVETGAIRYALAPVAANDALAEAQVLVEPQALGKSLSLIVESCEDDVLVRADAAKLRQILVNLLGNAVKFTSQGHVTARCAMSEMAVTFTVEDSGIGIAAENLERIFEPFVQVGALHTRVQHGIGLGLAISRDLARGMGGELTASSVVGRGSTFTLLLPRA